MFVFHRIPCHPLHLIYSFLPKSWKTSKNIQDVYFHPLTPIFHLPFPTCHSPGKQTSRRRPAGLKNPPTFAVLRDHHLRAVIAICEMPEIRFFFLNQGYPRFLIIFVCHISMVRHWIRFKNVRNSAWSPKNCTEVAPSEAAKMASPSRPDPTSLGYRTPSQSPNAVRATNPQRQRSWRIEAAGDPDAPIIWDCTHNWMINGWLMDD